jgi:hypothetical protein
METVYIAPTSQNAKTLVHFGEDAFWLRATKGIEPESSARLSIHSNIESAVASQRIPTSMKEVVLSLVSLIKVEAQFNDKKVGRNVFVGILDRASRKPISFTFPA